MSSRFYDNVIQETKGYNIYALPDDTWEFAAGNNTDAWSFLQGPAIIYNEWTHLAATYDGTTLRFYVNGIMEDSMLSTFIPTPSAPLRIAAGNTETTTANYFFPGALDEVRIWDYARTETQINDY